MFSFPFTGQQQIKNTGSDIDSIREGHSGHDAPNTEGPRLDPSHSIHDDNFRGGGGGGDGGGEGGGPSAVEGTDAKRDDMETLAADKLSDSRTSTGGDHLTENKMLKILAERIQHINDYFEGFEKKLVENTNSINENSRALEFMKNLNQEFNTGQMDGVFKGLRTALSAHVDSVDAKLAEINANIQTRVDDLAKTVVHSAEAIQKVADHSADDYKNAQAAATAAEEAAAAAKTSAEEAAAAAKTSANEAIQARNYADQVLESVQAATHKLEGILKRAQAAAGTDEEASKAARGAYERANSTTPPGDDRARKEVHPPSFPSAKAANDNYRPARDVSFVSDAAMDLGFESLMVPPETRAVIAVGGTPLLVKRRAGLQKNRM